MTALLFIAGLVLLVVGGEFLVRGAARLAATLGVPSLIIGLTVVAFGTSSPELAVNVQAGLAGQADIAVGNVVGSNIFNVLFILGLSAVIVPLVVSEQLVRLDVPVMIAVSALFFLLATDGVVGRVEAMLLVGLLAAYLAMQLIISRRTPTPATDDVEAGGGMLVNGLFIAGGLVLLVLGSRWLVQSATAMAEAFGVSQLVVGLTVVAAGTSMPEVATSVIAGIRGQRDIAVGNVIGSNIFNILAVVGFAGIVTPGGIPVSAGALAMDIPVMVAVALLCLPIFITRFSISRIEGLLFLGYYALYTTYLVLDASGHDALDEYRAVVLLIVLPLTLLTLAGFIVRGRLQRD
ncbi:MAG TPA: calcium/sodium antiporter [Longimicrobiales bacterium]|nr:calcium/sodium antiporter [Longimicrobiales bacterium]